MVSPVPSSPQPALPKTSGALVFQIFNPVNYAEGSAPASAAAPADSFQKQAFQPNPAAPPQQQLMDAYNNAVKARNDAEQARNSYLNLANQLNGQAAQNQFSQGGFLPNGMPVNPAAPNNNAFAQPPALNPQQAAQMAAQQQQQALAQQQAMQQQQAAMQAQQQAQQQAMQAQQAQAEQAQQQQQPQGLAGATTEELNRMIAAPQTLQEKVDAMEEIGVRGQGTPETYELLKQEALSDTSALPPGQAQDDANYVRQAALWTLGMLNKAQNAQAPTEQLPGLTAIEQIINNKNENPDVQAAAVQALQVIDRPNDKKVKDILKKASKSKNPDVKRLAQEALAGKSIPLPTQGGAAPAAMFR